MIRTENDGLETDEHSLTMWTGVCVRNPINKKRNTDKL